MPASDIVVDAEFLAREIESLMAQPFYKKRPDARVALAAAAGIVRRGRKLTTKEQLKNLTNSMRDSGFADLADRIDCGPVRDNRHINECPCGRTFIDGETCSRGGCPMGGDF